MKVDNFSKNGISKISALSANLVLDLHSVSFLVAWMKPRSGSTRPLSESRSREGDGPTEMTRLV